MMKLPSLCERVVGKHKRIWEEGFGGWADVCLGRGRFALHPAINRILGFEPLPLLSV